MNNNKWRCGGSSGVGSSNNNDNNDNVSHNARKEIGNNLRKRKRISHTRLSSNNRTNGKRVLNFFSRVDSLSMNFFKTAADTST